MRRRDFMAMLGALAPAVLPRAGRNAVVPVRPVSRFPRGIDLVGIGRVLLLGDCREWVHLVEGVPVACAED